MIRQITTPVRVFESSLDMSNQVASEIATLIKKEPEALICIAAGHTSLGLFHCLSALYEKRELDFSKAAFVAMDEWLGMSPSSSQSCGDFLTKEFLDKVNFQPDRVCLIDASVENPEVECLRVEQFILDHSKLGVIQYLVLGSGMNGHIALNEPGTEFNMRTHVTNLDRITTEVGQKYFEKTTELTGGITLGIANFNESERCVLMINGQKKRSILNRILNEPVGKDIPATAVRKFPNASIYCDRDAFGDL